MNEVLDAVGDAGFTLATIGANLFVLLYSTLAKPWKTSSGLHILSFMLVVALMLNHASVRVHWPDYPGHMGARAVLYVALAAVLFWRVLILLKVQIAARKEKSQEASVQTRESRCSRRSSPS